MGHVTGAGQLGLHAGHRPHIHGAWAAECLRAEWAAGFARKPQAHTVIVTQSAGVGLWVCVYSHSAELAPPGALLHRAAHGAAAPAPKQGCVHTGSRGRNTRAFGIACGRGLTPVQLKSLRRCLASYGHRRPLRHCWGTYTLKCRPRSGYLVHPNTPCDPVVSVVSSVGSL
eukprot:scaffold57751_cov63-Phaeocystis_antarctica.AAC.2